MMQKGAVSMAVETGRVQFFLSERLLTLGM
jgi:hypothetical protein